MHAHLTDQALGFVRLLMLVADLKAVEVPATAGNAQTLAGRYARGVPTVTAGTSPQRLLLTRWVRYHAACRLPEPQEEVYALRRRPAVS